MVVLFLSTGELFFVGLVVVMLFGSKKIPEIARGLGKGIREFKNATSDIQEEIRKTSTKVRQTANIADPAQSANPSEQKEDQKTTKE